MCAWESAECDEMVGELCKSQGRWVKSIGWSSAGGRLFSTAQSKRQARLSPHGCKTEFDQSRNGNNLGLHHSTAVSRLLSLSRTIHIQVGRPPVSVEMERGKDSTLHTPPARPQYPSRPTRPPACPHLAHGNDLIMQVAILRLTRQRRPHPHTCSVFLGSRSSCIVDALALM